MQTFLPYPDFDKSAKTLDRSRLGKQRVEAYQILQTLSGISDGWKNHPAVRMWDGYEVALSQYLRACILEWQARGYQNNIPIPPEAHNYDLPNWMGGPIHSTHRSNLLRKQPEYYSKFGWDEGPELPYYWPR